MSLQGDDEFARDRIPNAGSLARRFPEKAAVRIDYDQGLSHRIEAGCDFYLMPSRFEPCGLNQMYSLRYGTVPIVRATGGSMIRSLIPETIWKKQTALNSRNPPSGLWRARFGKP